MKRAARKGVAQRDEFEIDRQQRVAIRLDFVRIELELADTFCKMALETHSAERKRQLEFNAHRALDEALHTLTKLHLKESEAEAVVKQIEEVKALLEALETDGQSVPKC